MAVCKSAIERKTPRRMRWRVILEKKFSTALSQEAEVGVKWKVQRGWRDSQANTLGCEKSQIQALDRTQPGLPIKPGRCQTMTHDYKRHGTTTLFAALSVLDGRVIGRCMQRHRHIEFIRFLTPSNARSRPRSRSMRCSIITPRTNIPKC